MNDDPLLRWIINDQIFALPRVVADVDELGDDPAEVRDVGKLWMQPDGGE